MAAIAGTLLAVITAVLAATLIPNGVGHDIQCFDRSIRVVAGDDQLAGHRTLFLSFVADDDAQARPSVQSRRERIVDQFPEMTLSLKRNALHVQSAVAHVADSDHPLRAAAGLHSAETERPSYREFAGWSISGDMHG